MSTIFFIHDFSPSRIWTHALLQERKNIVSLGQNNIVLAPFNSWACEPVPSHYILWDTYFANAPLPASITQQFQAIASHLANGKKVLLLSHALAKAEHEFFWKNLENYIDLKAHDPRALFILGPPGFLLENFFREALWAGMSHVPGFYAAVAAVPQLIGFWRQRFGEQNCQMLPHACSNAFWESYSKLPNTLGNFLGARLEMPPNPPLHPLAFRSGAARRLLAALEVGENAWPRLDMQKAAKALFQIDRSLKQDFMAPQEARNKFADKCVQQAFEALCSLPPDAFAIPDLFYTSPSTAAGADLPAGTLQDFLVALDGDSKKILAQRFFNDSRRLSPDQSALKKCLETKRGNYFARLEAAAPKPLLTVLTLTYNQEKYIGKCLESVLAQQTNFPVLHLVLDHHSEDGTAAIVAEYASRYPAIRPILLSQRRWLENVKGLFGRCSSVYAALCDGDDYFTDPCKLQRQVDYLEQRPDFAMCFHPVAAVFEDGGPTKIFPPLRYIPEAARDYFDLEDLVKRNFIQTNSVVYRWRFREGLPGWFRGDLVPGDWYWHMLHAEMGKIGYIPRVMSVYRRHSAAIYYASARSSLELRRAVGLEELAAYRAYNEHFKNRFLAEFQRLAWDVFGDFESIAKEGDRTLLDYALSAYPEFRGVHAPAI